MLSQFSIQIMTFYILTRVFSITHSTVAVSLIWIASSLPALLFGPFSGAIVDSFSRRKLLVGTAVLQAAVVSLLFFASRRVFLLYVIVFLYWLFDQLYYPSQQATAPSLVNKSDLPMVNGLFLLTQQVSVIVGYGLGGILLTVVGPQYTILFAVVNLLVAAIATAMLPSDKPKRGLFEKDIAQFFTDFAEGYSYVKNNKGVLGPLIIVIGCQVFITIISTSLPTFTQEILSMDITHAGSTLIVPAAVGAIISTVLMPNLMKKFRARYLVGSGLLIAALGLIGLSLLAYLPLLRVPSAVGLAVMLGVSVAAILIPSQSLLQERTPELLRGRIFGQLGFMMILATTIPIISSAAIADFLGISVLMGLLGLVLLAGFILMIVKGKYVMANRSRI